jgi:hypothetical protein
MPPITETSPDSRSPRARAAIGCLTLLLSLPVALSAQREPVLKQVRLPHN